MGRRARLGSPEIVRQATGNQGLFSTAVSEQQPPLTQPAPPYHAPPAKDLQPNETILFHNERPLTGPPDADPGSKTLPATLGLPLGLGARRQVDIRQRRV